MTDYTRLVEDAGDLEPQIEKVGAAAVRVAATQHVYTGPSHWEAMVSAIAANEFPWLETPDGGVNFDTLKSGVAMRLMMSMEEGFVTTAGRFVDRDEAFKVAMAAGQTQKKAPQKSQPQDPLDSSEVVAESLNEMTLKQLTGKQVSIYRLFPDWDDRTWEVAKKGGVRLRATTKDTFFFSVHCGRYCVNGDDTWYDVVIQFADVPGVIKKYAGDPEVWKKGAKYPDLRKLAHKVVNNCNMKLWCSDPSFLYYGYAYILTKNDAIYGTPEHRPPRINNPGQFGATCKHIDQLLHANWPFYGATVASWLKKYWSQTIRKAVEKSQEEREDDND